jgi:RPA family protein
LKCARGEGHPLWVLTVGYPAGKTCQLSLRPEQVRQVREAIERYHDCKQTLEAISELNQFLLRLDREESKKQERES